MRLSLWILAASILFLATPAASAKEFPPGDLFLCGATQCREVSAEHGRAFSSLLWGDRPVTRTETPRVGSPVYQLRFRNGPAGVMLTATAFRVHGLNCSRFQRGRWYRLPRGLRGLTTGPTPKHLRSPVPRSC
jgi:hypothetical protein